MTISNCEHFIANYSPSEDQSTNTSLSSSSYNNTEFNQDEILLQKFNSYYFICKKLLDNSIVQQQAACSVGFREQYGVSSLICYAIIVINLYFL